MSTRLEQPSVTTGSPQANVRVFAWLALAIFTAYHGIRLAVGPARDLGGLTWTPNPIAATLAIVAVLCAVFGRAAYITYTREVRAPEGAQRFYGARLSFAGELLLTVIGSLLLLAATLGVLHVPETLLASTNQLYRGYEAANPAPNIVVGLLLGSAGFALMTIRRYVWEMRAGQPLRRYWTRAFARGRVSEQPLVIYWTMHFEKATQYTRVATAHWLRVADPTSFGFFRDADLVRVPLETPQQELAAIADTWRVWFAHYGVTAVITENPENPEAASTETSGALTRAA